MTTTDNAPLTSTEAPERRGGFRITLWVLSVLFVAVAMFTSGYLSYSKLTSQSVICADTGIVDCDAVTSSRWSVFLGVPVAYLGFISYTTLMALLLLEKRVSFLKTYGLYMIFGLILFDFMFHVYLTYNSVFVLQKICLWCVTTHLMATLMLIVTSIRVWKRVSET